MTLPYDFFLTSGTTSLGFNTAISTDRPYQRATAQFRKDQLDSQANVGDQSLTGWWTRGQLSFHKGAGLKYYEVLDGETVLSRYRDSEDVAVFEPGEVTLSKGLSSLGLDTTDAVPAPLSGGGGIYALASTGVEYTNGTGSLLVNTSDGNIPTAITSSGKLYFVANGTKIERQFAATDARVNHVTNPSFETGTTTYDTTGVGTAGWTWGSTSPSGLDVRGDSAYGAGRYGSRTLSITYGTGVVGHTIWTQTTVAGLTIGETYVASAWVLTGSDATNVTEVPLTMSIGGISADTGSLRNQWVNLRVVFTATATSHVLKFNQPPTLQGSTDNIRVDAVLVTESPFAGDYFDGSQPGCSWQGTPNNSKSNYVTASSGVSTVRITSSDAAWDGVWWAKGRLWAVDDTRHWYALADQIATVTNADSFWTSGSESARWSLADSPGAVYISDGSDIFAISLDTDGLVPTIGTPTTVARLPLGEQVISIAFYLSNLVVVTTRGVRVAVVQSDKIFLGPLTIEGDFTNCTRVGAFDTIAYVPGRLDGRGGAVVLCAIDLATANDDLTYPWSSLTTLSHETSAANGAVVDSSGRIYAWAAGELLGASLDERATSGYLTTGFHRFGTLDSKFFASLSVRLKGTGSVEVFRIDGDDNETSLGTLDASAGNGELDLDTAPAERIALRFVLTRDATDSTKGPTLLGYQLKALPVPKRQRMIRMPLLLFDKEQNRSGQTMAVEPWDRLAALEALEVSNAVVSFSDAETGESGEAYIESVEVERSAPAARGNGGFGGFIFVTLRKL